MKTHRSLVILALMTFGLSSLLRVHAEDQAYLGPEIEFQGKKFVIGQICTGIGAALPDLQRDRWKAQALTLGSGGVALLGAGAAAAVSYFPMEVSEDGSGNVTARAVAIAAAGALGAVHLAIVPCKNNFTYEQPGTAAYDLKMEEQLKKVCADGHCQIEISDKGKYQGTRTFTLTYPDRDLKIRVFHDPNTIEVNMRPMTAGQFEENASIIQKDLYEPLKRAGLRPPRIDGPWNGGHIHLDIASSFDDKPELVRRFLVDMVNHEGIFNGPLGWDPANAGLISQNQDRLDRFKVILERLESAYRGQRATDLDIFGTGPFDKNSSINTKRQIGTVELRGFRSQADAQTLAKLTRLLEARVQYLKTLNKEDVQLRFDKAVKRSPFESVAEFYDFVVSSGLKWEDYRDLMPSHLRAISRFQKLKGRTACEGTFGGK